MHTSRRMSQVYNTSKEITFDNSARLIFFSDCHRGDNSWADDFAHNCNIFFSALNYYYENGFIYIEIGDGDELWKNKDFSEIRQAHSNVFWLIRRFHEEGRLHMLWGNHDIVKRSVNFTKRNLHTYYDRRTKEYKPLFRNIKVHEGLIFRHVPTLKKIFVVHGHQGDFVNDRLWRLGRFLVRVVWRQLELIGVKDITSPAKNYSRKGVIEKNIINWIRANNRMVIAGHTHRPMFPEPGNPPYFNTGSCVHPRCITGIEIQNGTIALIKWSTKTKDDGTLYVGRDLISGPKKLELFL